MTDFVQRVAMKAVLVHNGKILLLREADTYEEGTNIGKYHMPGGRINPGEHWQDGLEREVFEETGIKNITVDKPLFVDEWFPTIKGVPTHIVVMFHLCRTSSEQVILSIEHDAYVWVGPQEWQKLHVMSPEDKVIEQAFLLLAA